MWLVLVLVACPLVVVGSMADCPTTADCNDEFSKIRNALMPANAVEIYDRQKQTLFDAWSKFCPHLLACFLDSFETERSEWELNTISQLINVLNDWARTPHLTADAISTRNETINRRLNEIENPQESNPCIVYRKTGCAGNVITCFILSESCKKEIRAFKLEQVALGKLGIL